MRRIAKPLDPVIDVFRRCAAGLQSRNLKGRMARVEPLISALEQRYDGDAYVPALHSIPQEDGVGDGEVTAEEMASLYKNKFSKKNSPGREVYDRILSSSDGCPLCGTGVASTLDHYLPKSRFPGLAVTPINLVPACSDCNKAKHEMVPSNAADHTIHPYYDDFNDGVWLAAELLPGPPLSPRFLVRSPAGWSVTRCRRVLRHFEVFNLSRLYLANASQELASVRLFMIELHEKAGAEGVREHLAMQAASRSAAAVNSWQAALYSALAESAAYCNGEI